MISPDMKSAHPISNEYNDDFFEDDMSVDSLIDGLLESYDGTSEDYVLDENGQWIEKQDADGQETARQDAERDDDAQKPTRQEDAICTRTGCAICIGAVDFGRADGGLPV